MGAKYDAITIAKYIVQYCAEKGVLLSNIKLQKILYFVFGFYFNQTGNCLFSEGWEAWQHGPVVPEVYERFSMFGGSHICLLSSEQNVLTEVDAADRNIIDKIIEKCKDCEVFALVDKTHESGMAWDTTVKAYSGHENHPPILLSDIKAEFALREGQVE